MSTVLFTPHHTFTVFLAMLVRVGGFANPDELCKNSDARINRHLHKSPSEPECHISFSLIQFALLAVR